MKTQNKNSTGVFSRPLLKVFENVFRNSGVAKGDKDCGAGPEAIEVEKTNVDHWQVLLADHLKGLDRMSSEFYSSFDSSAIIGSYDSAEILGEGLNFQFRMPNSRQLRGFAVGKAKAYWKKNKDQRGLIEWKQAVIRLQRNKIALIPPVELIVQKQQIYLVMPFGNKVEDAETKRIVEQLRPHTLDGFRSLGVSLDDIWQCRVRGGVPYLIDFSDLLLA